MGEGLLCIGLTTLDMVARPIDALPTGEGTRIIEGIAVAPAGTAAGAAMIAARLGVKTALAGSVGGDFMGRVVRLGLEEQGVDTRLLQVMEGYPTSATVLTIDSHGRRPNFHALGAGLFAPTDEAVMAAAGRAAFPAAAITAASVGANNPAPRAWKLGRRPSESMVRTVADVG